MLKKSISCILCIIMMLSIAIQSVGASSPVNFGGLSTVFEQNFQNLSGASDLPDFTVSGTWDYTKACMNSPATARAGIMTKKAIDLSDADGYVFKASTIINQNGFIMNLGWNSTDGTGYQIYAERSKMYLYENKAAVLGGTGYVASMTYDSTYGAQTDYTVTVLGNKITVAIDGTSAKLEYTSENAPDMSGIFGVRAEYTTNFAVFSMSLAKSRSITVNDWKYEKTFSANDSRDALIEEGLTLPSSVTFADGYAKTGSNVSSTYAPNNDVVRGSYNVELKFSSAVGNQNQVQFNYIDKNNYYTLYHNRKAATITLQKYTSGTAENLAEAYTATGDLKGQTVAAIYKIAVSEQEDGSLSINASVSYGNETASFTAVDSSPFKTYGKIRLGQSYTGASSKLYYIKAYSTPSEESVTRDVTYIDKTVTAEDSFESLANNYKLICSGTPVSITDSGINWGENTGYVTYDRELSGNYTISTSAYVTYNYIYYTFNYKDASNYYRLTVNTSKKYMLLEKISGGKTTKIGEQVTLTGETGYTGVKLTFMFDVVQTASTFDLNVKLRDTDYSFEDTDSPITSGKFKAQVGPYSGGTRIFYGLKVTGHESSVNDGTFKCNFYVDNEATEAYRKGAVSIDCPLSILGNYKVVASLYEDNMMTAIKILNPVDIYGGRTQLFDTSDSEAQSGYVKVYFFDSTSTFNRITDICELR